MVDNSKLLIHPHGLYSEVISTHICEDARNGNYIWLGICELLIFSGQWMNHTYIKAIKNIENSDRALSSKKEVYPPGGIRVENNKVM